MIGSLARFVHNGTRFSILIAEPPRSLPGFRKCRAASSSPPPRSRKSTTSTDRFSQGAGYTIEYPPRDHIETELQMTEEELLAQLPGCVASLAGSEPYTRAVIAKAAPRA